MNSIASAFDQVRRLIQDCATVVRSQRRIDVRSVRTGDGLADLLLRRDVQTRERHQMKLVEHVGMLDAVLPFSCNQQPGFGNLRCNFIHVGILVQLMVAAQPSGSA